MRFLAYSLIFGALFLSNLPTFAQTSSKDIEVASKAVKFLASPPSGAATAFVVFDPANPASVGDADAIASAIGDGLKVGGATFSLQKVAIGDVGSLSGTGMVIITVGMEAHHQAIGAALSGKSLVSLSTDFACVRAKQCVVGVTASPKVRIVVSQDAASQAGVSFKAAFLLLAEKI